MQPRGQYRPVLLDPDGGALARRRPQGGDGDAVDRRADRCGDRALLGLVNRVVPREGLRDAVDGLARQIAGKSAFTVKIGKEAFYRQAELDLAAAYRYAAEVMTTNMLAEDAGEGIDAFLARRTPVWHDR